VADTVPDAISAVRLGLRVGAPQVSGSEVCGLGVEFQMTEERRAVDKYREAVISSPEARKVQRLGWIRVKRRGGGPWSRSVVIHCSQPQSQSALSRTKEGQF
jgi:hypothetical protein